jgi:glycosyltransferase involved in cell wall biosynthesis
MDPKVSVVIPTRNRPELVSRAVRSALQQTYSEIEVIVVIDGPDEATVQALKDFPKETVRVLALAENVGGSEARNIGFRAARGEWIALLDDDDEWHLDKIEKQLALAKTLPGSRIIVTCRYLDQMGDTELVRPQHFLRKGQQISDFLYSDVSWLGAMGGFPQTSTWLVSRGFLLEVPFRKGLRRNQDTDWLLQALRLPEVESAMIPETLSIFHNEAKRVRITKDQDWNDCREWAVNNRELFTKQALSTYMAIMPVNLAAAAKAGLRVKFRLFNDCWKYGAMNPKIAWLLLLFGFIYPQLRKIIKPGLRKRAAYYTSQLKASRET